MNSGSIHGLFWFPNLPEKYCTWGQEISLYEVRPKDASNKNRSQKVSSNFLASHYRYQYVPCVQPSYHKEKPMVAVGLSDGKVGISDFHDTVDCSWEYTPRQQRMCLCLAWNAMNTNILAIGHDKHRQDYCITIWDIERGLPKETDNFFGISESAHSMCWDSTSRILIAGMSQKVIRLLDPRQMNSNCQTIPTKTVHGLALAPNDNYLCSYLDSTIAIWDLRAMDRQFHQIQSNKNHFLQISWCSTKSSLLSSLQRESPYIALYDVHDVEIDKKREAYTVKKQLLPFHNKHHANNKGFHLSYLSWHPTDFERALVLSESGTILDFKPPLSALIAYSNREKIPVILQRPLSAPMDQKADANRQNASPSPSSGSTSFDFTNLSSLLNKDVLQQDTCEEDLVAETKRRALNDYGLKTDVKRFGIDKHLNKYLSNVWKTLSNLYNDEHLTGLKEILGIGQNQTAEALMSTSGVDLQWPDFINNSSHLRAYRSKQRDVALQRCGWVLERDLDGFVTNLCNNLEHSRAAMICVFYLKVLQACDILSKAADASKDPSMFRIAAIALSSFNADRCSSTWRNQRSNANMQIRDAHLRAIFSFLTTENENFDAVLNEDGISLADRIAFACKYLSESRLSDYVKQQIQKCSERGDLNGLLLTGESVDGINILQAYIDRTADVQTVALVPINYFKKDHFHDDRIKFWINSYMDILNSWGLWEKRAELEIKIESSRPSSRSTRSVIFSCNFCGKSVATSMQDDMRMRASSSTNKLSSCPSCRKPLPRCALCLLRMGTTLNTTPGANGHESLGWQSRPFSKWFSWCQTCRHGGHTEHILQWFKQNTECPVSSCHCKCFDMDASMPPNVRDIS